MLFRTNCECHPHLQERRFLNLIFYDYPTLTRRPQRNAYHLMRRHPVVMSLSSCRPVHNDGSVLLHDDGIDLLHDARVPAPT